MGTRLCTDNIEVETALYLVDRSADRATLLMLPPACFSKGKLCVGDKTKGMNVTDSQVRLNEMMSVEKVNGDPVPVCEVLLVLHAYVPPPPFPLH